MCRPVQSDIWPEDQMLANAASTSQHFAMIKQNSENERMDSIIAQMKNLLQGMNDTKELAGLLKLSKLLS